MSGWRLLGHPGDHERDLRRVLFSGYMEYGEFESQPGSSGASTDDAVSSALRALRVPPQGPTPPWERGLLGVVLGLLLEELLDDDLVGEGRLEERVGEGVRRRETA